MEKRNLGDPVGPVACRSCDLFEICSMIDTLPAASNLPRSPTMRIIERGETLYMAGEPATHVYALRKGLVKSEKLVATTDKRVLALHVPGEVLGEEAVLNERYSSSVKAITRAIFCELPLRSFLGWGAGANALRSGLEALAQPRCTVSPRRPRRVQERLTHLACDLGDRLRFRGVTSREIPLDIPRRELARMLGASVASVHRALMQTNEHDAIRLQDNRVILRL